MITPERWLSGFKKITIKDHLRDDIIRGNAARLLGLDEPCSRRLGSPD